MVLDERVDERDNKVQASFAYDLEDFHNNYKLWYGNYNNVMVAYNANNEAVYVISFANYDGDMSGNDGLRWDGATFLGLDGHNAYADFAQNVWAHIIPDQERTVNQAPGVELRVGGTTVQKLSADATVGIPYSVWKHFANPVNGYTTENTNTLMYFTPVLDTEISTRGAKTFMSDSFAVEYSVIDPTLVAAIPFIEEMTEDSQVYTTRVNVQSLTGNKVTSEYTYQYYFKAPNHAAQLLDVTSTNPLSKDSVKLGNDRYENLQAFVLAFEMSENATAVWHFTSERGENFTIIVAGGEVVWNNAPADIDTLREVLDTFSVDVYAECAISVFNETTGEIAPVLTNDSHKTTYSTNDAPAQTDLEKAQAAVKAAEDADPIDPVLVEAARNAVEKIKDLPEYAELDARVKALEDQLNPGPGEEDITVTVKYDAPMYKGTGANKTEIVTTIENVAGPDFTLTRDQLIEAIPAALKGNFNITGVTYGDKTAAANAEETEWSFTGVENGPLTVVVAHSEKNDNTGDEEPAPPDDKPVGGDGNTEGGDITWDDENPSRVARTRAAGRASTGTLTIKVAVGYVIDLDESIFSNIEIIGEPTPGEEADGKITWSIRVSCEDRNNYTIWIATKEKDAEDVTVTVTLDGEAVEMTKNEDGAWTGTLSIPEGKKLTETSGETWTVDENNVITVSNVTESITIALTTEDVVEDNAPVITLKLVDAEGKLVDAADATLVEVSHKENISGGKTTYNYEFQVTILDSLKYTWDDTPAATLKDANDANEGSVTCDTTKGIINATGVEEDATLTVTLKDATVVKVIVSDDQVLEAVPSVFASDTKWGGQTITLSLKEGMADQGYGLPMPIVITGLTYGTHYTYDLNTGVITFKSGVDAEISAAVAGGIKITSSASLADSVGILVTGDQSASVNVGPKSIKMGTLFNSNPTITVKSTSENWAIKDMSEIVITMKDRAGGTVSLVEDTDWTYEGNVITLQGDKSITGDITLTFARVLDYAIKKLTVPVSSSEAVTPSTSSVYSADDTKWAVVDPEQDKTLFDGLTAEVDSWIGTAMFASTDLSDNWDAVLSDTDPRTALTIEDNGSYLVCLYLKGTGVVAAGYTLISDITGAPTDAPVKMTDPTNAHLTPTIAGNVITLTPDAGYLVPSDIVYTDVKVNNVVLSDGEMTYVADRTENIATITLNVALTGPVEITAVATEAVEVLKNVTMTNETGIVTGAATTDWLVLLSTDANVMADLAGLTKDATLDTVVSALGLTQSVQELKDAERIVAGNTAMTADDGTNSFVLYLKMNASGTTIDAIAIVENTSTVVAPAGDVTVTITGGVQLDSSSTTECNLTAALGGTNAGGVTIISTTWASGDDSVATVDNTGKVAYAGAGSVKITATIIGNDGATYKGETTITCT
ncbi:MAG: Ig-like domain-containing protein [Lachnospiraceae bacterium]|nr:Ig-like domain-containing protein [Lachnospiraceae bacterium]